MKNESAFPRIDAPSLFTEGGLSKREWFAGLAMQGMLANAFQNQEDFGLCHNRVAVWSKRTADALIAELERKEE